jgi:hypothetical protein
MPEETAPPAGAPDQITATFNPDDPSSVVAAVSSFFTFTRAPDFKKIFSDVVRYRVSNGFITLLFSTTTSTPGVENLSNIVEDHTEIVMTWIQLKIMLANLNSILSAIETEIEPIRLPNTFRINDTHARAIVQGLGLTTQPTSDTSPRTES